MKNQKSKKIKTLLNEGLLLHQLGKLEEAKLIYESILKINSKQFEALHYLGTVCAQMGQYSNAIEFLNKAISINPKQYDSHSNLGNAFIEYNQYDINGVNEVFGPIAINNRDVIKIIAKTINAAGQEVGPNATGIVIEIYTDGTIRRVIR